MPSQERIPGKKVVLGLVLIIAIAFTVAMTFWFRARDARQRAREQVTPSETSMPTPPPR